MSLVSIRGHSDLDRTHVAFAKVACTGTGGEGSGPAKSGKQKAARLPNTSPIQPCKSPRTNRTETTYHVRTTCSHLIGRVQSIKRRMGVTMLGKASTKDRIVDRLCRGEMLSTATAAEKETAFEAWQNRATKAYGFETAFRVSYNQKELLPHGEDGWSAPSRT